MFCKGPPRRFLPCHLRRRAGKKELVGKVFIHFVRILLEAAAEYGLVPAQFPICIPPGIRILSVSEAFFNFFKLN